MWILIFAPAMALLTHAGPRPRPPPKACDRRLTVLPTQIPQADSQVFVDSTHDRFIALALGRALGKTLAPADSALIEGVRAEYAEIFGRDLDFKAIAANLLAAGQTRDEGVVRAVTGFMTKVERTAGPSRESAPPPTLNEQIRIYDRYRAIARQEIYAHESAVGVNRRLMLDIERAYRETQGETLDRRLYVAIPRRMPDLMDAVKYYLERITK